MRKPISATDAPPVWQSAMHTGDRVRAILRLDGWTQQRLAQQLSVSQSTVHRWIKGSSPEGHHRDAINDLYTTLLEGGAQDAQIALKGYIGAGQTVEAVEGGPEYVPAPPDLTDDTVAATVRGDSMLPMLRDGWTIYWSKLLPPVEMVGKLCVVQTTGGEIMVKTLHNGSEPGKWNLVSFNADVKENVRLEWAAPIDWIRPA